MDQSLGSLSSVLATVKKVPAQTDPPLKGLLGSKAASRDGSDLPRRAHAGACVRQVAGLQRWVPACVKRSAAHKLNGGVWALWLHISAQGAANAAIAKEVQSTRSKRIGLGFGVRV